MTARALVRSLFLLAFMTVLTVPPRGFAIAQEQSAEPAQATPADQSVGAVLARETREETGEEENENLKHSAVIKYLARKTGMTVHQTHLVAVILNFLIIAFLIYWYGRKMVPPILRSRTESIQRALQEAQTASQEASRRLAEIEARLNKLDAEIGQMQAASEKEAEAEEARIKQAAEEEIRKVVQAAEQEIASAAKQARRELIQQTADLAVALARKQIQVDATTDQVLVRNFASKLSSGSGGKDRQ